MKAAFFEGIGTIKLREVPVPQVDDDSVLIRVMSCAICGSDLRILNHGHHMIKPPHILGHEICGEVVEAGKNVTKFKVGDRVAVGADVPCGQCDVCRAGHGNYCPDEDGMGYSLPGGFAEYCLLNKKVIQSGPAHKIPDHVSWDQGALAEPLACILNGFERIRPELNDVAVLMGAGPIGCMMIPVLYRFGCSKVIVANRSPARIELARRFNADSYIVSGQEDLLARVMEETGGRGADYIITANPSPDSHKDAIRMAAVHGKILLFGGMPAGTLVDGYDTNSIHYKELIVSGCHGSVPRQHKTAVDMIASGTFPTEGVITHTFGIDQVEEAFAFAQSHQALKVVVHP